VKPTGLVPLLAVAAAGAHIAWAAPRLPATVASHFDAAGHSNGWMSREAFLGLYAAMIPGLAVLFALAGGILERVPDRWINLPNKAYWLHPSRRAETFAYWRRWFAAFGGATLAFLIAVMHLAIRANLADPPVLGGAVWGVLAAFLLVTGALTLSMLRRFGRIPPDTGPAPGDPGRAAR
jgi:ABC-type Fe3+-siderophore transport system permease subunit